MSSEITIGLPRALLYYEYGAAWEEFLRILGATPLLSGPTTRSKIEAGLCEALDEACLPVKVAYGHCLHLAEQVDRIFVPRVVSTEPKAYSCPKLLGLPDMIRLAIPGPVSVLSPLIDLSRGQPGSLRRAAEQVAAVTGAGRAAVGRAVCALATGTCAEKRLPRLSACRTGRRGPAAQRAGNGSEASRAAGGSSPGQSRRPPVVGLVGHAYNILDDGLNLNLREKLTKLGVSLVTPEDYDHAQIEDGANAMLKKPLFWTLGRKLAGAASLMSRDPGIEGMIAVVSFGCGLDSMVIELAERLIRRARPELPFMLLTLDEHTGEAGLRTRLEAFTDLVIRKRAG